MKTISFGGTMGGLLKLLGLLVCVLGGWVLVTGQDHRSPPAGQRSFAMGLAYWPAQGEKTTQADAQTGVGIALENSEHILVQIPWSPFMKSAPERAAWMAGLANSHGHSLTIAIDWIDEDRKGSLNTGVGEWSFENAWARERFLSDIELLARRYKPQFMVLGVEVDFIAHHKPELFQSFVTVYESAYRAVKSKSPETQVAVSFQFEHIFEHIRDSRGTWNTIGEYPVVTAFGPLLDVLGLSVYPCRFVEHPTDLPADYLSSVITNKTPVAIFETAWPTNLSDEKIQKSYVEWLLGIANSVSSGLLVWVSATDSEAIQDFESINGPGPCSGKVATWKNRLGLWRVDGAPKLALVSWQKWLVNIPRVRAMEGEAITDQRAQGSTHRY
ncbi:MAG: hypothetical protein HOK97_01010 [Deltaproteobacteria bacterium]|nr:hypothetical protein [Deltaproteobacteria bacterium]